MPSWKKLIISGSDAALTSLVLTTGSLALNVNGRTRLSSSVDITGSLSVSGAFFVENNINTTNRALISSAGFEAFNYEDRTLKDEGGNISISYGGTAGDISIRKPIVFYYVHKSEEGDIVNVADSKEVTIDKNAPFILIDLTEYTRFDGVNGQLNNTYYKYTYTAAAGNASTPEWLRVGEIEVFKYGDNLYFSESIKTEQGALAGTTPTFSFDQGTTVTATKLYFTSDTSTDSVRVKYKVLVM
jgi:hypothetical protein